jgi:hypothetical protein
VGWFVAGDARSFLEIKKGAACLLSCDSEWGEGTALLRWALAPAHLRALSG